MLAVVSGAIFVYFRKPNTGSESFTEKEYQQTREKIETIIKESVYYKQVGGYDLEYLSKDSDYGTLRCPACDGFAFRFKIENNKKIKVNSGFSKPHNQERITVDYVDAYNPANKNTSYDLLNNEEDPLNQPVGPVEEANP